MEIRPLTPVDPQTLGDIDATVESAEYLHLHHDGQGLTASWKVEPRRLPKRRTHRHAITDEQLFAIKQIVAGIEEGVALAAEHEGRIVAAAAARIEPVAGVLRVIDLRVDFDFRRQGLASALLFQLIQEARQRKLRAVSAETRSDDFPVNQLLAKLNFEFTGFDTHAASNHDLVKESVVLFWYLPLD